MRKTVYAAWALAFCAASADAFLPAGAPARLGLRCPSAAVCAKGSHAAGCSCGVCGSFVRSKRVPALSMAFGRGSGDGAVAERTGVGMDSTT